MLPSLWQFNKIESRMSEIYTLQTTSQLKAVETHSKEIEFS